MTRISNFKSRRLGGEHRNVVEEPRPTTFQSTRRQSAPTACRSIFNESWARLRELLTKNICAHASNDRLAKDQTEINRIIAEVSKGSKFYEVRHVHFELAVVFVRESETGRVTVVHRMRSARTRT